MDQPLLEGKSLTDYAYETLLERILSRELSPGTFLRERRMAEEFGVSRTPVREAIGRLEAEGLVVRDANQIPQVKEVTINEYLDALFLRQLLEGEAARLAAPKFSAAEVGRLRALIHGLMDSDSPSPSEHWRVDDEFHGSVAKASGNAMMVTLVSGLRRKTQMFNLTRLPDRFIPGCEEHLAILTYLEVQDSEGARMAMHQHLTNVRESILIELKKLFQRGAIHG